MTDQGPKLAIGQHSEAGRKDENQDSYGVLIPSDALIPSKGVAMAVADGMSSSAAGKEASENCVKTLFTDYFSTPETWTVRTAVGKLLTALNRWLHGQGQSRFDSNTGMVSTLSAVILKSTTAHVFHVGDTRIGLIRGGKLEPLTRDHVMGEALVRGMGADAHVEIDYRNLTLEPGDHLLFTTDGVHGTLSEADMLSVIAKAEDLDGAARDICALAFDKGSTDNLTCQVVRIDALPEADEKSHLRRLRELPFPPELEPGMVIDGYKVVRELHASNRSQVHLVIDQENGDRLALKTLSVNYDDDPVFIELFLREEWVGKRISSPHVLSVPDRPRRRKFLYWVGEYVEGPTLRQWMNDNPKPSLDEVRGIVEQVALGLRAFHRKEMVHQDLKPDNIVIDADGTVKIIDFGSVRILGFGGEQPLMLGTKDYTAPEVIRGQPGTPGGDLYALGVIAYEMLSGGHPYGKGFASAAQVAKAHYRAAAELPHWIDGALAKAVHLDPRRRYQGLSEFLADLRTPNPAFAPSEDRPLLERNPVRFWKVVALVSLLLNVLFLLWR